jgi:hypothetical protein
MGTSYDLIFPKFMHEIDDFDLTSMIEEDMLVENKLTLSKAVTLFKRCKQSLSRSDTTELFTSTLTEEEMWILADYMRKVWLDEKINNGELLKLRVTDKDFKTFSPADQLTTMNKLKLVYDKELKLRVNDYLYDGYLYSKFYKSGSTTSSS